MSETLTLLTAEQFLADPAYDGWELVDGVPVERHMGLESNATGGEVFFYLRLFLREHPHLGRAFPNDVRVKIWPDRPNLVRRPDVTFIRAERAPSLKSGELLIAPDLVVEVISTHDEAREIEAKRLEYLEAGIRLMWVIYPETRTVHVYRPDGSAEFLGSSDSLSGEDVVPGFSVPVSAVFVADEA